MNPIFLNISILILFFIFIFATNFCRFRVSMPEKGKKLFSKYADCTFNEFYFLCQITDWVFYADVSKRKDILPMGTTYNTGLGKI